ncbi:hypothetical protein JRI60_48080 [Archangium violaceum]|uniref:hypothetical protein n=1 Tax=Archangium violaceum TaxID=83451 RepID=UPI00194DE661|nr:hypothetical protein [Archangium violaceum]QRN96667.1 hypothetical protein JRI60_48080 [Archangium violaceum]
MFRHPRWLAAAAVAMILVAGAGLTRLEVDENNLEQFGEETPLRQHTTFVENHLGGTTQLIVSIRAAEPERFLEPAELRKLEALDTFLTATTAWVSPWTRPTSGCAGWRGCPGPGVKYSNI